MVAPFYKYNIITNRKIMWPHYVLVLALIDSELLNKITKSNGQIPRQLLRTYEQDCKYKSHRSFDRSIINK